MAGLGWGLSTGSGGFRLMAGLSTGGLRSKVERCKPGRVGFQQICVWRSNGQGAAEGRVSSACIFRCT